MPEAGDSPCHEYSVSSQEDTEPKATERGDLSPAQIEYNEVRRCGLKGTSDGLCSSEFHASLPHINHFWFETL